MSARRWSDQALSKAAGIRLVVFDIDGVMTDGRLYRSDDGQEIKAFHSRDGLGLKALMHNGFTVAVLTARQSNLVRVRMRELGIERLIQGREDKGLAFSELLRQAGFESAQAAYMGDDLVDWPAMLQAGLKICPADADGWIRERVDHVTQAAAGRGAAREACELLLDAHGLLDRWRASFC
ncbi:MAG: phenylphosphate carboxylase subunit delta [Xanthomonadaceae bacterium]|nr:phenylphosphate carboxylase subunit delta [Xanthomonadaceae bacterium]